MVSKNLIVSTLPNIYKCVDFSFKVQVMNGQNIITESSAMRSNINIVKFSPDGSRIAIGLENGDVMEFDYKNRKYKLLMKLHDSVKFLEFYKISPDVPYQNGLYIILHDFRLSHCKSFSFSQIIRPMFRFQFFMSAVF